jgi:hypothetical protein
MGNTQKSRGSMVLFLLLCGALLIPQVISAQQESRSFALTVNPLGFIQFGPTVSAEFALTPNTFIGPTIRFVGFGLLSHIMVGDSDEDLKFGTMSAGLQFRQFMMNPSPSRLYFGGTAEFGWGGSRGSVGYSDEWESSSGVIVFMGNFGNRWRFPSGFFVNVGIFAGFANELSDKWWYLTSPNDKINSENNIYLIGMVELSIGFEN